MRTRGIRGLFFVVISMAAIPARGVEPPAATMNTELIERLTGAKGRLDEAEGVFKVSLPRADLNVTVARARITPPMGLTSWASFQQASGKTMVMGDLVLLEDQVNPVMSAALEAGLEVTALHNHFLFDSPRVMFMHISGVGNESSLAASVGTVFARIQSTSGGKGEMESYAVDPAASTLDPGAIESILGHGGEYRDGVYRLVIGRKASMHGAGIGGTMGVNTWAAFAGSNEHAVVDGDFAVRETELQAVLKALRKSRIQIVAIHQHMMGEDPRYVFLHYWGSSSLKSLAWGIRAALDVAGMGPADVAGGLSGAR